ncbi:DUF5343 domain-containing protein [Rhizobium jaguaris]|uniref:DUF5343 domain-containing protein n=1 Tax=Rhizobium jaguaris TaxID=1312183 RepID=UPI0039BFD2CC
MASHPYISGPGNITQMIGYLRKNFPASVTSDTVKKFQLASNNESYVINALQFVGLIDEEGKRTESGHQVLLLNDVEFPKAFADLVRQAYKDLFDLRSEDAWSLSKAELTGYFRTTDKTSEVIGGRQAAVFQAFAALAGYEQVAATKTKPASATKLKNVKAKSAKAKTENLVTQSLPPKLEVERPLGRREMALTVRVEINLPAEGSRETYDHIFKSIKANLLDE